MIRGVAAGTGLGILAAAVASLCVMGGPPDAAGLAFMLLITAVYAGPGAILVSIPLTALILRLRQGGMGFGPRCVLSLWLGLPLGLMVFIAVMAARGFSQDLLELNREILWHAWASAAGGAGLGLGCALGTLRRAEAAAARERTP